VACRVTQGFRFAADVQIAGTLRGQIVFNVHARCATSGSVQKPNRTTACEADAAVGYKRGTARGRAVEEGRAAAVCAADCAAVVGDGGAACGRGVVESREAGACAANCGDGGSDSG